MLNTNKSTLTRAATVCMLAILTWLTSSPPTTIAQEAAQPQLEASSVSEEKMNNDRLAELLQQRFQEIDGRPGFWVVTLKVLTEGSPAEVEPTNGKAREEARVEILVITDETADRMRIMMPVQEFDRERDGELAIQLLEANFDRALDAKYALNENILWSTFMHPLGSLTEEDLDSALRQVITLTGNTGTTFASTDMIFGGDREQGQDDSEDALD